MKGFVKKDKRTELEKQYDEALLRLRAIPFGSKEYVEQFELIERMHAMLEAEKGRERKLSPDGIATCVTGVVQVGMVIGKEKLYNITSKAMNFVMKGRVR